MNLIVNNCKWKIMKWMNHTLVLMLFNMYFHCTVEDDINECYPVQQGIIQKLKAFFFRTK